MLYDKKYPVRGLYLMLLAYPFVLIAFFANPPLHSGIATMAAPFAVYLFPIGAFWFYLRLTKWRLAIDIIDTKMFIRTDFWRYHFKLEDVRMFKIKKAVNGWDKLILCTNRGNFKLNARAIEGGSEACRKYLTTYGIDEV